MPHGHLLGTADDDAGPARGQLGLIRATASSTSCTACSWVGAMQALVW